MRPPRVASLAVLVALVALPAAEAGSQASTAPGIERFGEPAVRRLAEATLRELEAREVNVAFIARTGRRLEDLPDGVGFTHVGLAVYEAVQDTVTGEVGYTYSVYNLYEAEGGGSPSFLAQDFVYDTAIATIEPRLGIVVPTPEVQKRLASLVQSGLLEQFHNPRYNLIANPARDDYDNCVSILVEILFASIYETTDISEIKAEIARWFPAQEVKLSLAQRLGARMTGRVALDDQEGTVRVATMTSIARFLRREGLLADAFIVTTAGEVAPFPGLEE